MLPSPELRNTQGNTVPLNLTGAKLFPSKTKANLVREIRRQRRVASSASPLRT